MIDRAVTLLPLPLSPTRPNVSPSLTSKEMPSTALIWPRSVSKKTCRSLTSRSMLPHRGPRIVTFQLAAAAQVNRMGWRLGLGRSRGGWSPIAGVAAPSRPLVVTSGEVNAA